MAAREPYSLAIVVEVFGSSSAKAGAKALFDARGRMLSGWIGGGCAQTMTARAGLECLQQREPRMIEIDLNDEVFGAGMPCGGHMRVYVEPVLPPPRLWLLGFGGIAEALNRFAQMSGFEVVVNDPQATDACFPGVSHLISDDPRYQKLEPASCDFVIVATHHKGDYDAIIRSLASPVDYIALVASRTRAQLVLQRLANEGVDPGQLQRVRSPAGLNLGAKTPEEIALAIVSEMVMVRRKGDGVPLSQPVSPSQQNK